MSVRAGSHGNRTRATHGPCVRIGAIAHATVTVVGGYLPTIDRDKVQMVERDTATPLLESLTIQSINYGTGAITFTTTPSASWAAKIAAGIVDLRLDHSVTSD